MSVVLHLYVCLFVSERDKRKWYLCETPTYFNILKCFVHIMCYYVVWGCFAYVFRFWYTYFELLTKIHQNQFFIYFYGFKLLVWYNLVLCYSLDPVLVIWHVTFIIFLQNQVVFSKLKKVSFGKSKLGYVNVG